MALATTIQRGKLSDPMRACALREHLTAANLSSGSNAEAGNPYWQSSAGCFIS